jgi:hypothetical protein
LGTKTKRTPVSEPDSKLGEDAATREDCSDFANNEGEEPLLAALLITARIIIGSESLKAVETQKD